MKQVVMTSIEPNELADMIAHSLKNTDAVDWEKILTAAVPRLTKSQSAKLLGCSNSFIDQLVSTGKLQVAPKAANSKSSVEKYTMAQVLECLRNGDVGRNQPFTIEKIA